MNSETTIKFRKLYSQLPKSVKENTRKAYKLWQTDLSTQVWHLSKCIILYQFTRLG
jgi:hypothetical protein